MKLHNKILIGLLSGVTTGMFAQWLTSGNPYLHKQLSTAIELFIAPFGQLFLRLILMVLIPLVVSALILGVTQLGKSNNIGSVGFITFKYAIGLGFIAAIIGLVLVNVIKPGAGLDRSQIELITTSNDTSHEKSNKQLSDVIYNLVPKNPIEEMAFATRTDSKGGGMISIMFFSVFFAYALSKCSLESQKHVTNLLQAIYDACLNVISIAMKIAPYGVGCLMFTLVYKMGFLIIKLLSKYVMTVLIGLSIQQFIVYSIVITLFTPMKPLQFFKKIKSVMFTGFSTSSSHATMPHTLDVAQKKLKLTPSISRFVITLGATCNQNGSALYEGITVLFLAQAYGIDLTFMDQTILIFLSIIASVGTAGAPGGSIPFLAIVLQTVGVPASGILLILGLERLLDMFRTVVNVSGDVVLACWVDYSAKKNDKAVSP
ncbi:dicarboxylate/amino acid:cation symporter [Chlamydiia bacterium]|nr:dicarboxylate/amino acid:cation symporter [Chlamydiia bacterium]